MKATYYRNGSKKSEIFADQDRVISKEIQYYDNGSKHYEIWYKEKIVHRDNDLPAVVQYNLYEEILVEKWIQNNKLHRDEDKPALIKYNFYPHSPECEMYYKNDKLHRNFDLPAAIYYEKENNYIQKEEWYCMGFLLRLGYTYDFKPKPSVIVYKSFKNVLYERFIIDKCELGYSKTKGYLDLGSEPQYNLDEYFLEDYDIMTIYKKKEFVQLNDTKYLKIIHILRRKILGYKQRKIQQLLNIFKKSKLEKNGNDINKVITVFLY